MQKRSSPFHPQEAKTLPAGKVIAKKVPKPLEKAPVPVPDSQPEPEPEPEPVKEEKLSPEPILVNLTLLFENLLFLFLHFTNGWRGI